MDYFADDCFYEYARGRYALNGRVTFSGLAYLLLPCSHVTCHRLVYSYISVPVSRVLLRVPVQTVESSPATCLCPVSPFVLSTCTLTFLAYAFLVSSCRLVPMLTITAYDFPFVVGRLVSRLVISGL